MNHQEQPGMAEDEDPRAGKIPPEILVWANQHFNEEEALAGLRQIQETGGFELKDFIQDLERAALPHA